MADLAYLERFELRRPPFSIAPDPRFLYLSDRHREAFAHLLWGLGTDGGFVVLTGEVGTGKTTLCRSLLERIPEDTDIAFVINPRLSARELLATLCEELGDPPVEALTSNKRLVDRINHLLLDAHARGRRTVLVIDEAQNLTPDVLEQIRLLTNLETSERKLLQVVLIGQPELDTMLRRNDLRQLAQRITARYHLEPLSRAELDACIRHRLEVAGARSNPFTARALGALHRRSRGIPRIANLIADRALLGAYAEQRDQIGAAMIHRAAREVAGPTPRRVRTWQPATAAGVLLLAAATAWWWTGAPGIDFPGPPSVVTTPAPALAPVAESTRDVTLVPAEPEGETATDPVQPPEDTDAHVALVWDIPEGRSDTAFQDVVDHWYVPFTVADGSRPCGDIARVGLACLEFEGTWDELIALDLPAILNIEHDGRTYQIALTAVSGDRVRVAGEAGPVWVERDALLPRWDGSATVLWQLPPGYRHPIARGQRGEPVRWLRSQLAAAGHPAEGPRDAFNTALERAVRAFQTRSDLVDDGIAGPLTWIHLQRLTGTGIPSLSAGEDD